MDAELREDENHPRKRWLVLIPLLMGILTGSLSMGLITVPAARIGTELAMTDVTRAWLVDVYPLGLAVALVTAARLGDRCGRRTVMLAGLAATAVGNTLIVASTSGTGIILLRAVMGVAGAAVLTSVVATIASHFRGRDLVVANGAWVAVVGGGNALGPVVGGVLTDTLGWRAVFILVAGMALLTMTAGAMLMPQTFGPGASPLDAVSLILSAIALGGVVYAVKQVLSAPLAGGALLVLGTVATVAFARRQLRLTTPLLDVRLFRNPSLTVSAVQIFTSAASAAACIYLVSIHLQTALDLPATEAGMALVPIAGATVLAGLLAPRITSHIDPATVTRGALLLQALGLAATGSGLTPLPIGLALVGAGYGTVGTIATTTLFQAATATRAAQAGVIQETSFAVGSGIGIAIFSSLASFAPYDNLAVPLTAACLSTAVVALFGDLRRRRT